MLSCVSIDPISLDLNGLEQSLNHLYDCINEYVNNVLDGVDLPDGVSLPEINIPEVNLPDSIEIPGIEFCLPDGIDPDPAPQIESQLQTAYDRVQSQWEEATNQVAEAIDDVCDLLLPDNQMTTALRFLGTSDPEFPENPQSLGDESAAVLAATETSTAAHIAELIPPQIDASSSSQADGAQLFTTLADAAHEQNGLDLGKLTNQLQELRAKLDQFASSVNSRATEFAHDVVERANQFVDEVRQDPQHGVDVLFWAPHDQDILELLFAGSFAGCDFADLP
jgi:hypothetical protein